MNVTTRKIALRGQVSPSTSLKIEQLNLRREKSKSTIQQIMEEIYQEENKNSKIIKYLTQNAYSQLSPVSQTPKLKQHVKHESIVSSIRIPPISHIKTVPQFDAGCESPRSKIRKFDLEIEDPNILSIYQLSACCPLRRSTKSTGVFELLMPKTVGSFDDDLKRKKEELEKYMLSNTDVMAKIHQKQDSTEKMHLIFPGPKKGKNNAKLETIKKRFIKVLNRKNIERLNKLNEELAKELSFRASSPKIELRKSSSLLSKKRIQSPELFGNARQKNPQKPLDIKSKLKKMILESEEKQVVKLTTIEKIKEKYQYPLKARKLDLDLLEKTQKSSFSPKKSSLNSPEPEIRLPFTFFSQKQKESLFLTNLSEMKSPKQKFEVFYNDLNGYYSEEVKDKWDVEKEISHQVKVYDTELKKINERLFEFNANLDKEFDKEAFENGIAARFSSVRRAKRKR